MGHPVYYSCKKAKQLYSDGIGQSRVVDHDHPWIFSLFQALDNKKEEQVLEKYTMY